MFLESNLQYLRSQFSSVDSLCKDLVFAAIPSYDGNLSIVSRRNFRRFRGILGDRRFDYPYTDNFGYRTRIGSKGHLVYRYFRPVPVPDLSYNLNVVNVCGAVAYPQSYEEEQAKEATVLIFINPSFVNYLSADPVPNFFLHIHRFYVQITQVSLPSGVAVHNMTVSGPEVAFSVLPREGWQWLIFAKNDNKYYLHVLRYNGAPFHSYHFSNVSLPPTLPSENFLKFIYGYSRSTNATIEYPEAGYPPHDHHRLGAVLYFNRCLVDFSARSLQRISRFLDIYRKNVRLPLFDLSSTSDFYPIYVPAIAGISAVADSQPSCASIELSTARVNIFTEKDFNLECNSEISFTQSIIAPSLSELNSSVVSSVVAEAKSEPTFYFHIPIIGECDLHSSSDITSTALVSSSVGGSSLFAVFDTLLTGSTTSRLLTSANVISGRELNSNLTVYLRTNITTSCGIEQISDADVFSTVRSSFAVDVPYNTRHDTINTPSVCYVLATDCSMHTSMFVTIDWIAIWTGDASLRNYDPGMIKIFPWSKF